MINILFKNYFSNKDLKLIVETLKYIKPYKGKFVLYLIINILSILLNLIGPLLFGFLLTYLYKRDTSSIINTLILFAISYVITIFVNQMKTSIFSLINNSVTYDIKDEIYIKILKLPLHTLNEIKSGKITSMFSSDANVIANFVSRQIVDLINDVLYVIIIGFIVLKINIVLGIVTITFFPLSYYILLKYGKILREQGNEFKVINDNYFSILQETLIGIKEIKSIGIIDQIKKAYDTFSILGKTKKLEISKSAIKAQTVISTINSIQIMLNTIIGIYFILRNSLSMETFIAFSNYSTRLNNSLMSLTSYNSELQQVLISLKRIFNLLDNSLYKEELFGSKRIEFAEGKIIFKDVYFEYIKNKPILKNISFTIPHKGKYAIVGLSGSGKTTLFNLLLRLYSPQNGKIFIDGNDISELDELSIKNNISIVNQEPFLFNKTIKENLICFNKDVGLEELDKCCKIACIYDYIIKLPERYNTVIYEKGSNLSIGQKQRIALARALLKNPKIILLDEVTSSLDNNSQYYIDKAIDSMSKTCTVIAISHKLSSIMYYDKIFFIDNGQIVSEGTHSDLIIKSSNYKKMFQLELMQGHFQKTPVTN